MKQRHAKIHSFVALTPVFPPRNFAGAAHLGGLKILYRQQQSEIILLASH